MRDKIQCDFPAMAKVLQRVCRPSFAAWLAAVLAVLAARTGFGAGGRASFYDDVKPILSIHCYKCHGPETAKSDLRLDLRERALKGGKSGARAVAPGESGRSEHGR